MNTFANWRHLVTGDWLIFRKSLLHQQRWYSCFLKTENGKIVLDGWLRVCHHLPSIPRLFVLTGCLSLSLPFWPALRNLLETSRSKQTIREEGKEKDARGRCGRFGARAAGEDLHKKVFWGPRRLLRFVHLLRILFLSLSLSLSFSLSLEGTVARCVSETNPYFDSTTKTVDRGDKALFVLTLLF